MQLTSQAQRSNHFSIEKASRNLEENTERPREKWAETRTDSPKKTNNPQIYKMMPNNAHKRNKIPPRYYFILLEW